MTVVKKSQAKQRAAPSRQASYERFALIDGQHDYKRAVPNGSIEYSVRRISGGKVAYFNFDLAKEMGLITEDHPHEMSAELAQAILETFSIQIINEYDLLHRTPIAQKDIKPHKYMATRYLQLQHPDKRGLTSGDGRSVWNGQIRHKGTTWDVSSCGTGATRLSPATALEKKFFKTGDPRVCYGCGRSDVGEGLSAAIMSEIFHRNGIATERTLTIVEFPRGVSINVRAGKNLLRPAHMFLHLKQGNERDLRASVDYYIDRQVKNGTWDRIEDPSKRYFDMAEKVAESFARMSARYQSDYIFVWMDWDGDNILTDGGIIDYGSIRQFGLCHSEYRYDDVDRFSTNLLEQKTKAREIVQMFVQIADFLVTGRKKSKEEFARHPIMRRFDRVFSESIDRNLLYQLGLNRDQRTALYGKNVKLVKKFKKLCSSFELEKSSRGKYKTQDGVTWDAIYSLRDILRELPHHCLKGAPALSAEEFTKIMIAESATKKDRKVTPYRAKRAREFQYLYWAIIERVAALSGKTPERVMREMIMRSSVINKSDRITGDGIIEITDYLLRKKKTLNFNQSQAIIEDFIHTQKFRPVSGRKPKPLTQRGSAKMLSRMIRIVRRNRQEI